jgi:Beta-propeller repeat
MDDEGESTQHRLYRISPAALKDSAGPTDYYPEECIVRVCSLFVIAICWLGTALAQTNAGLPAFFERNMGQAGQQVAYFSRAAGYVLYIEADGASFVTRKSSLKMRMLGADTAASPFGLEALPGRVHYLIGNDPGQWLTDVPTYVRVRQANVYPGVDLVYYSKDGNLEWDLVVAPGADPGRIRLQFAGMQDMKVDTNGDLVHKMDDGAFRQRIPVVYQMHGRTRRPVSTRYTIRGRDEIGFELASYDRTKPLVIDPQIIYSTYEGGTGNDSATGVATDAAGCTYLTGWTETRDLPGSATALGSGRGVDAFVAKISPDGASLSFLTYLGASAEDRAQGIAVDSSGSPVITGWTYSTDFPRAGMYQRTFNGGRDAFVAKLNSTGNALLFSTMWGSSGYEGANALALDSAGGVYITGETDSTSLPLISAYQSAIGGGRDCFVAKFNSSGIPLYSTYLGGRGNETCNAIAVDSGGNAYITGGTDSTNFPVLNAYQANNAGGQDAFIAKLSPYGNSLLYSTYMGGSGGTITLPEAGSGIAVDNSGSAYVTGITSSVNFPTANPLQNSASGGLDAFVLKMNSAGNALVYSTYLGGKNADIATAIAVDSSGCAHITGYTMSQDFPMVQALQSSNGGAYDIFLARLNPAGSALNMSTYVGGSGSDAAYRISLDGSGNVYLAGSTLSPDFPTVGAMQTYRPGTMAAVVIKISTASTAPANATLISPAIGTVLSISTVTFTWNAAAGAVDYWLDIGSAPAHGDIAGGFTGGATFKTVDLSRFLTGQTIYVQLYTRFPGIPLIGGTGVQYQFATASVGVPNPTLISPATGTVLSSSPVTFTWNAVSNAQDYWIDVGTAPASGNIAGGFTGGATSKTVDMSAFLNGQPVYIQLYTKAAGVNPVAGTGSKYQFATSGSGLINPTLTAPTSGMVLSGSQVTFTWNPISGAQDYWIDVGTAVATGNIASGYTGGATSKTVNLGSYLNGQPVYIQLYTKMPGVNPVGGTGSKYQFSTANVAVPNPALISPAAGTVISTSQVTFTWNAISGAQDYWIDVGTSAATGDISSGYTGGVTSRTVDLSRFLTEQTIYVQLYTKVPGVNPIGGTGSKFQFATVAR